MPVYQDQVLDVLKQIAEVEDLKVTVKQSAKGGLMIGTGAFIGGLLGGPVGVTAGGIAASMMSYFISGQYKSVFELLNNLTPQQKQKLIDSCSKVLSNLEITDVQYAVMLIMNNEGLKMMVIDRMINFVKNEM